MGQTLFLWSVSLLACQTAEGQFIDPPQGPRPCASCQAAVQQQQQQQYQAPAPSKGPLGLGIWEKLRHRNDDDTPGPFARMQFRITGWFSHPAQPELGAPIAEGPAQAPSGQPLIKSVSDEPPLNGSAIVPAGLNNVPASNNIVTTVGGAIPSGYEVDYTRITGYLRLLNGQWTIDYSGPGFDDQFGGKLVLANFNPVNVESGDFVSVSGTLMADEGGQLTGTYYLERMNLISRNK